MGGFWAKFLKTCATCAKVLFGDGLGGPVKQEATKHKCAKTLTMLQCTNVNQGN
jgi:hypothetical protein